MPWPPLPLVRDRLRLPLLPPERGREPVAPLRDEDCDACPPERDRCADVAVVADEPDRDAEPPDRWLFVFAITCYSILEIRQAMHVGTSGGRTAAGRASAATAW